MKNNFLLRVLIGMVISIASATFFVFAQTETQLKKSIDTKAIEKIRDCSMKGDLNMVISEANTYLNSDPNNIEVLTRLAESYLMNGDLLSAEKNIKKALDIDSKNAWSLRVSAGIYKTQYEKETEVVLKNKYLDLALIQVQKALTSSLDDPVVNVTAAEIYFYKNDKTKAMQAMKSTNASIQSTEHFKELNEKIKSMP